MLLALTTGCSLAPAYHPPVVAAPAAFKETGPWVPAAPAVANAQTAWWQAFGSSELNALEVRLNSDNPTLADAYARWHEARAVLGELRADQSPQIGLGADGSANRQSDRRPLRSASQPDLYRAFEVGGDASYELDLWGRVRNQVASGRAQAAASADDVAAVRLSLEVELANDYIALNGFDREIALLTETVKAYTKADDLTQNRYNGGIADGIDTGRSGAELADAQAQLADVRNQRALVEHAIAALIGTPASSFTLSSGATDLSVIAPPDVLPSTLLQRRPDVAAAERRMFAANAQIGVARAAFYPSLQLGGNGGFASTALAGLLSAPNLFWSIGPNMVLPLFDGGRRRARVDQVRAQWEEATDAYRRTALGAFRDVEDGLSQLHHLGDEAADTARGATAASQAARLSLNRYVKGASNYLDVVTAQTAELTARRHALQVETARTQASVALVEALGGGWAPSDRANAGFGPEKPVR